MPRKKGQKNKKVSPYLILKKYRDDINRVLRPADYSYFIDNLTKGGYIKTTEEAIEFIKNIIIPIIENIMDQKIFQLIQDIQDYYNTYLFSMVYKEGMILITTFELPGEKYTRVEAGEIIYLVEYEHVEFQFLHSGEDQVEDYHTRLCLPSKPVEDHGSWFIDEPSRDIVGDSQITPSVAPMSLDLDQMPRHRHLFKRPRYFYAEPTGGGDCFAPQGFSMYFDEYTEYTGGYQGGNAKPHGHPGIPQTNDPKSMVLYYWLSRGTV